MTKVVYRNNEYLLIGLHPIKKDKVVLEVNNTYIDVPFSKYYDMRKEGEIL